MNKFKDIHNNSLNENQEYLNENKVSKEQYIEALIDLKKTITDKKDERHKTMVTSGGTIAKMYYSNALKLGNESGFFNKKDRQKINSANKLFSDLNKPNIEIISTNLDVIISIMNESIEITNLDSINGMGEISLPDLDGDLGSGDVLGGTAVSVNTQEPIKTIAMKKFEKIKENRILQEGEIYIAISDLGDTASLVSVLSKELSKRSKSKQSELYKELINIEVSYNGLVNPDTLNKLTNILDTDTKSLKTKIDKILDSNMDLLESLQVEFMRTILTNPKSINEGVIGRVIGGAAGFALGPKVGKLIAKVLGIEKGPLYNLLTSRVVSAALVQELTKNLL